MKSKNETYTPMMRQYLAIKENNRDAFLFYRMGDFYEMFFEDAEKASKLLDLVLTGRDCGTDKRAPMCGVPHHSAEGYINKLVSMGHKVAVCEQLEDAAVAKGLVKRDVVRKITPGTVMSTSVLEERKNNYLASIVVESDHAGLCFADVSAGTLRATEIKSDKKIIQSILDEISAYAPSEVVLNDGDEKVAELLKELSELSIYCHLTDESLIDEAKYLDKIPGLNNSANKISNVTRQAISQLYFYLDDIVRDDLTHMREIELYGIERYMDLPSKTRKSLELTESLSGGTKKGSLLSTLDKTKTAMGSRLLRTWIERPLAELPEITRRQNAVSELLTDTVLRSELCNNLAGIQDVERIMGQIAYGSANARTLLALGKTISELPKIKILIADMNCDELRGIHNNLDEMPELRDLLNATIVEEPPLSVREGGIIKDGVNEQLDRQRYIAQNSRTLIAELEIKERERTGAKNLKIGYNRVFGYYLEISKSFSGEVPEDYIRKQTISTGERYITPELKELENTILNSDEEIRTLEYEIFCSLRDTVKEKSADLMATAAAIARLDALAGLAQAAFELNYVRPEVDLSDDIHIHDGRHPVVESMSGHSLFVPNDTFLDCKDNRLTIITGPNMAGKSTYMRQTALIVILAQTGSFVPATQARIGLVDGIYTRFGSYDELFAGRSTFMVEMSETAQILNDATKKSLLIFDEIGRGTSTFDGMAIARAILEYIVKSIGAKTMFSTHYHELTNIENALSGVKNYNITAKKRNNEIIFLRKVVRGGADDSYGIEVGQLAGLPSRVISRAKTVLEELERNDERGNLASKTPSKITEKQNPTQFSLDEDKKEVLLERLAALQPEVMTPLEAMNTLYKLSKEAEDLIQDI